MARDFPYCTIDIELGPHRAPDFPAPRRRQDRKFERARRHALLGPQLHCEGWHGGVRHGGHVLLGLNLARRGEQVLKMAFPPGWVLALPEFGHGSPVEDALD